MPKHWWQKHGNVGFLLERAAEVTKGWTENSKIKTDWMKTVEKSNKMYRYFCMNEGKKRISQMEVWKYIWNPWVSIPDQLNSDSLDQLLSCLLAGWIIKNKIVKSERANDVRKITKVTFHQKTLKVLKCGVYYIFCTNVFIAATSCVTVATRGSYTTRNGDEPPRQPTLIKW